MRAGALLALLLVACGADASPPSPDPRSLADPPAAAVPSDPPAAASPSDPPAAPTLEGLEDLGTEPDPVAPRIEAGGELPPTGCVALSSPVRALEAEGRPAIVRATGAFFVAAYVRRDAGEALAIARLDDGEAPALFATLPIAAGVAAGARRAPPALAVDDARLLIAATDGDGALLFAELDIASPAIAGAMHAVAPDAHADVRFPPAVVVTTGATALAWTDGSGTPMRVRLARVDRTGHVLGTHDATPEAGGAAAPIAGLGDPEPTLYFVDPRISISVVSRTVLGEDGSPGPTTVVRPLARAADPASFVAVRAGETGYVSYVAVGSSGTRAVGLLTASGSEAPVPVVPGLGFGEPIVVSAALLPGGAALFAAEAPSAADPSAPHEVRLRVLAAGGTLSDPLVVPDATEPAIAAGEGGEAALATAGGWVTRLRCR